MGVGLMGKRWGWFRPRAKCGRGGEEDYEQDCDDDDNNDVCGRRCAENEWICNRKVGAST